MSTMEKKEITKRKPNWSFEEMEALAQAVADNIKVVKGKFTPSITNCVKNKCWLEITARVNAANSTGTSRDVGEVKKMARCKQSDQKKEAQRIRERKATGGGPSTEDDAKPWEKVIIGTFTRSAVEGVVGGVDTATVQHTRKPSSLDIAEIEGSSVLEASGATNQLSFIQDKSCTGVSVTTEEEASVSNCQGRGTPQFQKSRKRPLSNSDHSTGNTKEDFFHLEEERFKHVKEYRQKKIELQEILVRQQEEMLQLQRRSTAALEVLAMKAEKSQSLNLQSPSFSPFSVSPIIKL